MWSHQPAVLNAATALAWLTEASPNEQTTIASAGHSVSRPPAGHADRPAADWPAGGRPDERGGRPPASRRSRSMATPTPTARGRCEAIVEVVGTTAYVSVAEDLVPPAGHRLIGGGDHPTQYVPGGAGHRIRRRVNAVRTPLRRTAEVRLDPRGGHGLGHPGAVEAAGTVVQQSGIGSAQRGGHRRVPLVPGRADGVEPLAEAAQPTCREIQVPTGELGVEQRQCLVTGEERTVADRPVGRSPGGRGDEAIDRLPEPFVEILRGGHVRQHYRLRPSLTTATRCGRRGVGPVSPTVPPPSIKAFPVDQGATVVS